MQLKPCNKVDTASRPGRVRHDLGGGLIAWLLLLMGIGTFAPCILIPIWQSHKDMRLAGRIEQSRVDAMEARIEGDQRTLSALRNDPAVVVRLARRDLGMNLDFDQWVRVDVPVQSKPSRVFFTPHPDLASIIPVEAPPTGMEAKFVAVFRDTNNRRILTVMSVMLMGAALWLPTRRIRNSTESIG